MRLALHDYSRVASDGIVDGAVIMHVEMLELVTRRMEPDLHDLTRGPTAVSGLKRGDFAYAGCGPYAFLYHIWRKVQGTQFRIVREIHTSLWSGYWAQEELCGPFLRPGDLALFPSEYARSLFADRFPRLREGSALVYPMLHRLEPKPPRLPPPPGAPLRIGYLGALSKAKNFDQVLSVFRKLHEASGGRATLVFAGKPNAPCWAPEIVVESLAASGVPRGHVRALGTIPRHALPTFFQEIDVLLFPSTASRETLGRVVVEAIVSGVPVVAADIGPAVELLPPVNLVPASLTTERCFNMGTIEPLGRIDEDVAVASLLCREFVPGPPPNDGIYGETSFESALHGRFAKPPACFDRRIGGMLRVEERSESDMESAGRAAARLFLDFFAQRDEAWLGRIESLERATDEPREDLRAIFRSNRRSLADYRALPRLLDALVLSPLNYALDGGAVQKDDR